MLNRRQFVSAAAGLAGAAMFARIPNVLAQSIELIIKGGRVVDPSVGLDAIRDIAIAGGRIVAVAPDISGGAADTLDARGKIVTPGLIDIHTHAGRGKDGPPLALQDCVTGWVDAGTAGADNIDQVSAVARGSPQIGRVLVNIARTGVLSPGGELHDINQANVDLARGAIARHRDVVAGMKVRMSNDVAGQNDLEALRRAQEVATPLNLPVMIHVGQNFSPMRSVLSLLKRGDIVTHMYAPPPNSILDDQGRLLPEVSAARRRGVIFDFGNGVNGHFNWEMVETTMKQGFWPDTFSTDWSVQSKTTGVVDFPNVMSKFFMFGMSLSQIVARATVAPARCFPAFDGRGTLNVGAPADVAIMELKEGSFDYVDNYKGKRTGTQCLFPVATVLNGKRVARA